MTSSRQFICCFAGVACLFFCGTGWGAESAGTGHVVPRRLLVLYGHDPKLREKHKMFPIDTVAASSLQSHLEWLGYELDYIDAGTRALPAVPPDTAGIIMDGTLHLSPEAELPLVEWMNIQRLKHVPLLILGDVPVRDPLPAQRWQRDFGIGGTLGPIRQLISVKVKLNVMKCKILCVCLSNFKSILLKILNIFEAIRYVIEMLLSFPLIFPSVYGK